MSDAIIRPKIYAILAAVPNVGKTYDYERWTADWGTFIALFKDPTSGQILGWELCRSAKPSQYLSNAEAEDMPVYTIKGYQVVNDAKKSELSFNRLIDAICAAFRFNFTLSDTVNFVGPVSAEVIDTRTFGGVLCHYAELKIQITEQVH